MDQDVLLVKNKLNKTQVDKVLEDFIRDCDV